MADELEKIVQQIAVEGTGEMGAAFEEVARIAEAAFDRISKAASSTGGGIGMMTMGITGLVLAAGAAAYEIGKFAVTQAELGVQTVALAEATGMTTGQVKGLGDMFRQAGMQQAQYLRSLEQSVIAMANAAPRIAREQALSGAVAQEQDEKIIEGKLHVQDAMTNLTFASAEYSQKLQSDAIAVGEAWNKLKFESADMASQVQNDLLSVTGAHLSTEQAELDLRKLYDRQRINQYSPKSGVPLEMQTTQRAQDVIDRDRAELRVKQAKQAEIDTQTRQQKDTAQQPLTMARDKLGLEQAQTRLAKDNESTQVERATLDVAKARTANEKMILEIDIERANTFKAVAAKLAEGRVDKFTSTQKIAQTIEEQGGGNYLEEVKALAASFKAAKEARAAGTPDAMQEGTEMAVLRNTRLGGAMRSSSGQSSSELRRLLEQGPEGVEKWAGSRKDTTAEQISADQQTVDAAKNLGTAFEQLKESVGGLISYLASQQGKKPGEKNYVPEGGPTMAEGGLVVGPGTGTSDSINARLSHGEHVTKAAAVKFWGTDFMDAINNMRLPGFADGGMFGGVSLPASFSGAGMQPGGMGTVNLHLDGREFGGLRAPEGVMRELSHYAIGRQTSSTGRKPSWVR